MAKPNLDPAEHRLKVGAPYDILRAFLVSLEIWTSSAEQNPSTLAQSPGDF